MKDEVLSLLQQRGSMSLKEIMKEMRITNSQDIKELSVILNELEDERLIYNNHSKYHFIDNINWIVGRTRDISATEYAVMNKDTKVYVPKNELRNFFDRDEVLVRRKANGNEIVHVYTRGITYVTGTFIRTRRGMKFRSDVDLHTSFKVTNENDFDIHNNEKAVVKVTDYTSPLKVRIVRMLGKEGTPGIDVTSVLCENNVRMEFNKKVEHEADQLPDKVRKKELKDREDLRDLPTVTIDGESTKDFDDAISLEKLDNGNYRLWVHIADVSHYVEEGREIDEEAYKRGTSIYVADRVVPMLPFKLSNGICSLNPGVDRLTLSVAMDFTPDGIMKDYRIMESVIHSDMRCTYGKVNSFLEDEESVPEYKEIGEMLRNFSELAKAMKKQTQKRGHIEFETKEPYFILGPDGRPVDIQIRERGWSEQMIEEAMIAANVATAHELHANALPGMFRVHETPDPEKLTSLTAMARNLNVPCDIDPSACEPIDIARFLESVEDPDKKEILSTVAVRSMQKARYSEENLGHYGLALEEYCHFTSPIRRYPDLLIHRMLRKHVIKPKNDQKTIEIDNKKMQKSALHVSEKERDAVTVERAVNDLKSAEYMENKVGQVFEGVISGVTSFGFFVELENTIEGLVPMRSMTDDFYQYDEDTMTLTGENSGRTYKLGQTVRVRLSDVNVPKRQITFETAEGVPVTDHAEVKTVQDELPIIDAEVTEIPDLDHPGKTEKAVSISEQPASQTEQKEDSTAEKQPELAV